MTAKEALNNVEAFARGMETNANREVSRLMGLLASETDNRSAHSRNLHGMINEAKAQAHSYKIVADYAASEIRRLS